MAKNTRLPIIGRPQCNNQYASDRFLINRHTLKLNRVNKLTIITNTRVIKSHHRHAVRVMLLPPHMPKLLTASFTAVTTPRSIRTVRHTVLVVLTLSGLVRGQANNTLGLLLDFGCQFISPIDTTAFITNYGQYIGALGISNLNSRNHQPTISRTHITSFNFFFFTSFGVLVGSYGCLNAHRSGLPKGEVSLSLAVYRPPGDRVKTQISAPSLPFTTARSLSNITVLSLSQMRPTDIRGR